MSNQDPFVMYEFLLERPDVLTGYEKLDNQRADHLNLISYVFGRDRCMRLFFNTNRKELWQQYMNEVNEKLTSIKMEQQPILNG